MNYKHLSQIERYQIHSLMKAQHNITQIARLLGRDKSTISRELRRNAGCRGYRAKQACELASKRSESSRNASTLAPWVKEQARALLRLQWSPEQIASKLPVRRPMPRLSDRLRKLPFHLATRFQRMFVYEQGLVSECGSSASGACRRLSPPCAPALLAAGL